MHRRTRAKLSLRHGSITPCSCSLLRALHSSFSPPFFESCLRGALPSRALKRSTLKALRGSQGVREYWRRSTCLTPVCLLHTALLCGLPAGNYCDFLFHSALAL